MFLGQASATSEEVDPTSSFHSILFDRADPGAAAESAEPPEYFGDLHLDDIVASITAGREGYGLTRFFYEPLRDVATIAYRHEVFRDLEEEVTLGIVRAFSRQMRAVRDQLAYAANAHYRYERERRFLDAAHAFNDAVDELNRELAAVRLRSPGLLAFRTYLAEYATSEAFTARAADAERVTAALAGVRYRLRIQGGKITVTRHDPEPDLGAEVLQTFERFKQGAGKEYRWALGGWSSMNHVEAAILDGVARQHPEVFASLDEFAGRHREFLEPTIARFDREVLFYVAYLEHIDRIRRPGLAFCYPEVDDRTQAVRGRGVFDLALAGSLIAEGVPVVSNDVELSPPERIIVVSGPNQGGKTTFARTIGQLHHLARVGVLVPGTAVRLPLVDRIFTHFERQEQVEDLSSKLEDDLRRIHRILDEATAQSLLIMNESFSSTTVGDQVFIGTRVIRTIIDRGMLCVVVTFLDELAALDPNTVSMVSTVDPEEPARRTFRIVRRPADGLAYAMAIAEKHRLTYRAVQERVRQ